MALVPTVPSPPSGGTPATVATAVVVNPPPLPTWRWVVRYVFGAILVVLAIGAILLAVFSTNDEPTTGRKTVTIDRTFANPPGAKKPRVNRGTKTVTNTPSVDGGRPEWLVAGLLSAALFLALGGAFIDRDRLSFKFGKDRGFDVGGPDPQTSTSAALAQTGSAAPPKQAAEVAVQTNQIAKDGVPVQAAAAMAAEAQQQGVPTPPLVHQIVDLTAEKADGLSLDFSRGQLALSAVKAFDAHTELGLGLDKAAEKAVSEVAELSD